jgi:hypothetical protein
MVVSFEFTPERVEAITPAEETPDSKTGHWFMTPFRFFAWRAGVHTV